MSKIKHIVLSESGRVLFNKVKSIFLKKNPKIKRYNDAIITEDCFKEYIEGNK